MCGVPPWLTSVDYRKPANPSDPDVSEGSRLDSRLHCTERYADFGELATNGHLPSPRFMGLSPLNTPSAGEDISRVQEKLSTLFIVRRPSSGGYAYANRT